MATVTFTPDSARKFIRYVQIPEEILNLGPDDELDVEVPGGFSMTAEDLAAAVDNLIASNPLLSDYYGNWQNVIDCYSFDFGLERACGLFEDEDEPDASSAGTDILPGSCANDFMLASQIWSGLNNLYMTVDDPDSARISDTAITVLKEHIDVYFANKGKSLSQRTEWSAVDRDNFLSLLSDDDALAAMPERALELGRKWIDEDCGANDPFAMHIKAYACYGGNRLYACDWNASRDLLTKLIDINNDPQYHNTLGYIYYYGRCNGGKPEYDKAFREFSVSAACGLYEGTYKLGDMFARGYGCEKMPAAANRLYTMVYNDSFRQFIMGEDGSFADAALRMGNIYSDGIGAEPDPYTAYMYYLQAAYAIARRARNDDFFGDTTVAIGIRKALENTKRIISDIDESYFGTNPQVWNFILFEALVTKNGRAELRCEQCENGDILFCAERVNRSKEHRKRKVLVTVNEMDYCDLVDTVRYIGRTVEDYSIPSDGALFERVVYDSMEDRWEFYYEDDCVAWIGPGEFYVYVPESEAPSGKECRFVSVRFDEFGRTYDYLCDDPDITVGSRLTVPGYSGDTEVEVTDVFTAFESELPIPLDRYKKI